MNMKKTGWTRLLFVLCAILFSVSARADIFKNNFQSNLNQDGLDYLTKDLSALVGVGTFHTAKGKGLLPIGGDVGLHGASLRVNDKDAILRDDGKTADSLIAQGDLLLPLNLGIILRGGSIDSAKVIGGGIRYNILSMDIPLSPSLMISGLYDRTQHDYFNMNTYTGNLVLSLDVPIVNPYIGAGYDSSTLTPTNEGYGNSADKSLKGKTGATRFEAGVNLSFIPLTYITLAAGVANGQALYHAALGVHFSN